MKQLRWIMPTHTDIVFLGWSNCCAHVGRYLYWTMTAGHEVDTKHRKAEELIAMGSQMRILRESDFKQLVALPDEDTS